VPAAPAMPEAPCYAMTKTAGPAVSEASAMPEVAVPAAVIRSVASIIIRVPIIPIIIGFIE
jgi:hypothetical protein